MQMHQIIMRLQMLMMAHVYYHVLQGNGSSNESFETATGTFQARSLDLLDTECYNKYVYINKCLDDQKMDPQVHQVLVLTVPSEGDYYLYCRPLVNITGVADLTSNCVDLDSIQLLLLLLTITCMEAIWDFRILISQMTENWSWTTLWTIRCSRKSIG